MSIPLVDVVFVLLIIFMVTAPMLDLGMDITLPTSSSNTIKPEEPLVLTIERDQKVYLDKDLVPVGLLESETESVRSNAMQMSPSYPRTDPGCRVWHGGASHGWSANVWLLQNSAWSLIRNPRASRVADESSKLEGELASMSVGTYPQIALMSHRPSSSRRYV